MRKSRSMIVAAVVCAALGIVGAAEFAVPPGGSISDALARTRAAGGTNIVSLAAGDWYLDAPLVLDARDADLTLRGAGAGRTRLLGGRRVTGWRRDGDRFWCADLPGVKEGTWDFRALVVEGAFAPRACFPGGTNRLDNLGDWNLPLLPALAGHWARKPTYAELVTMPCRPGDLPDTMDFRNAEIRLYHMWAESLSGVASNDLRRHVVYLSEPAAWPMGACGRRQYEVYNVREGMTEPGQWYLDRTRGRVVYWPKPGEDMAKIAVVAPCVETVVSVAGTKKGGVRNVTLEDFSIQATTTPAKRAGFGGGDLPAALDLAWAKDCAVRRVEVCNVGGVGVKMSGDGNRLEQSDVHHTGARGVGVSGADVLVVSNRICHVGLLFPSSSAMGAHGRNGVIRRNEIFDVPYSGIIGGGEEMLFEENYIHHVMRVLHDGAAIYGNMIRCTMRGNVVRDIVPNGKGFGASAFYYDEGATDSVIERNVTYGVPRPIHEHMTRHTQVRDNTFITDGDLSISFQNSIGCTFERNTLVLGGRLRYTMPDAVSVWKDNLVFRPSAEAAGRTEIGAAAPVLARPKPQTVLSALSVTRPPVADGAFETDEWPGRMTGVNRDAAGRPMGGAQSYVRFAWDATNLYVGVLATNFRTAEFSDGATWGTDDGVEITVNGRIWRGFACGKTEWSAGTPPPAYAGRRKGFKPWDWSKALMYEAALPFAALGCTPAHGARLPFRVTVHNHQYGEDRMWDAAGRDGMLELR